MDSEKECAFLWTLLLPNMIWILTDRLLCTASYGITNVQLLCTEARPLDETGYVKKTKPWGHIYDFAAVTWVSSFKPQELKSLREAFLNVCTRCTTLHDPPTGSRIRSNWWWHHQHFQVGRLDVTDRRQEEAQVGRRAFLSVEKHTLVPCSLGQAYNCCLSYCVSSLALLHQGSRDTVRTTRQHLKCHWWYLYH